jgi:hypothetical protein
MVRIVGTIIGTLTLLLTNCCIGSATESACAVVLYFSDGFVAVRQGPTASSAIIDKVFPGQIIGISSAPGWSAGAWVRVDILFKVGGDGKLVPVRDIHGWSNGRLLRVIDCG